MVNTFLFGKSADFGQRSFQWFIFIIEVAQDVLRIYLRYVNMFDKNWL